MKNELEIILQKYDNPHYLDDGKEKGIRYNPNRNRHCSLGYHTDCFYPRECGCVCHRLEDLINRQKREFAVEKLKEVSSHYGYAEETNIHWSELDNFIDAKIKELTGKDDLSEHLFGQE